MLRLKELRDSRHMSQQELGDLVGLSKSSIGYYEQGKHQPDLAMLETLARFFNVSVDYLMGLSPLPRFELTEKEQHLIKIYRQLPAEKRDILVDFLKVIAK